MIYQLSEAQRQELRGACLRAHEDIIVKEGDTEELMLSQIQPVVQRIAESAHADGCREMLDMVRGSLSECADRGPDGVGMDVEIAKSIASFRERIVHETVERAAQAAEDALKKHLLVGYTVDVTEAIRALAEPSQVKEAPTMLTDQQIKHMVDRFLGWRLPEDFNPDAGISFKREFNENTPWPMKHEPTGTNLFDATQAEQMVRYLVDGMPQPSDAAEREHDDDSALKALVWQRLFWVFRAAHGSYNGGTQGAATDSANNLTPVVLALVKDFAALRSTERKA